jgi:hypothetical protein
VETDGQQRSHQSTFHEGAIVARRKVWDPAALGSKNAALVVPVTCVFLVCSHCLESMWSSRQTTPCMVRRRLVAVMLLLLVYGRGPLAVVSATVAPDWADDPKLVPLRHLSLGPQRDSVSMSNLRLATVRRTSVAHCTGTTNTSAPIQIRVSRLWWSFCGARCPCVLRRIYLSSIELPLLLGQNLRSNRDRQDD